MDENSCLHCDERQELNAEIERLRAANKFAEWTLSRWLAHQYSNQEQYRALREARDKLRSVYEQNKPRLRWLRSLGEGRK